MGKIRVGVAGLPAVKTQAGASLPDTVALGVLADVGIEAVEIEFVYGIKMSEQKAEIIGEAAEDMGIKVSVHAPFWINFASLTESKIEASIRRLVQSCAMAHRLGAEYVVFHPAFNHGRDENVVYEVVRASLLRVLEEINGKGWNGIKLAPETAGRLAQWGSVESLVRLAEDLGIGFCVDFAHIYARNLGKIDFSEVLDKVEGVSGGKLHCHFSGIEFTKAGERRHVAFEDSFFEPLAKELKRRDLDVTLICETPHPFFDAIRMIGILKEE